VNEKEMSRQIRRETSREVRSKIGKGLSGKLNEEIRPQVENQRGKR
jgi:hypothetical protein